MACQAGILFEPCYQLSCCHCQICSDSAGKMKYLLKIVFLGTMLISTQNCAEGNTAAKFKGGSISVSEVTEAAQMELFQVRKQEYEIKKGAVQEMLYEKILAAEASKQGKTEEQLLENYYKEKLTLPPEEQLKAIFEANRQYFAGGSFEDNRGRLVEEISKQQKNQLKQEYISSLFSTYEVEITLPEPKAPKIDINIENEPYWGKDSAKVVIVEFSDFECPYCKRMQPAIAQLKAEYSDKIKWVFKDFPLDFHPQAMKAHIATNCAQRQDKYWDYQQRVFNQPYKADRSLDLSEEFLTKTASSVGLDMGKFQNCLKDTDGSIRQKIQNSLQYAQKLGVRGTPTLFINGEYSSGMMSYQDLKAKIDSLL